MMKVVITITFVGVTYGCGSKKVGEIFCCSNLWKSKFMDLEKPGIIGECFLLLSWPPCCVSLQLVCVCVIIADE